MALKTAFTSTVTYVNPADASDSVEQEHFYPEAYVKVTDVYGSKEWITAKVTVYADGAKEKAVSRKSFSFAPNVGEDSGNFIRQAYLHIKNLNDFAGAEDC